MRFIRNIAVVLVAVVVAWTVWGRFGYLIRSGVGAELEARARAGSGTAFKLSELTDFEWEQVIFLGPYTSQEKADKALGFHWPEYSKYGVFGLQVSDTFNLLVFTGSGRVVYAEKTRRCAPDFDKSLESIAVLRSVAELSIEDRRGCLVLVRQIKRSNNSMRLNGYASG